MIDVFYLHTPTGLFPHEKSADCIEHARELSRTRYLWVVDGLNDYSGFDWLWEPVPWQSKQAHVWPSQHQDNGGTWLLPKAGYHDVNRDHPMVPRKSAVPRLHIKHISDSADQGDINTRFISDYLGTLKRALSKVSWEYCWVTTDVCDYSRFDFTWHPSEWQQNMLHVFASDGQRFGDTFYLHVPTFLTNTKDLALLEWFDTIHFVPDISIPRYFLPVSKFEGDSIVGAVWKHDFQHPLVLFYRGESPTTDILPAVNLWRENTKTAIPLDLSGSTAIIPRECKNYLRTQIYDYPYIDKTHRHLLQTQPQDIVFISYDEPQAENNWEKLLTKFPRAIRVHGVKGMEKALQAAADASKTPWYFAVFAKTELVDTFDFDFVPDYFQQPKHYIFDCKNPVNGLVYGHMGVVMYNCDLIMRSVDYEDLGLDFTLSFPHEVVSKLSCVGNFDSTPYHTWRTAFRETAKLAYFESLGSTVEGQYRLQTWLSKAEGKHKQWCLNGARDGLEFFNETQGSLESMKLSFRWEWLRQRFVDCYGNLD